LPSAKDVCVTVPLGRNSVTSMTSHYNIGDEEPTTAMWNYVLNYIERSACKMVYVLNSDGQPLMPTSRHGKVKHLLRSGKAVVVNRCPFTIKLTYNADTYTQPITLGIDAGSKKIGVSAVTATKEVYSAEVELRNDIVKLIATKAQFRRVRRNRKTRYRKPRFLNRTSTKKKGWLAPSIRHKINSHLKIVSDMHKLLPISNTIVEVASFDIQKIKNDAITGFQYQQGDQMGFWNVREYVLFRDNHTCQHCKGKSKDKALNVHHIESRKTGGDSPSNLITLCETCHNAYHEGTIQLAVKRGKSFRDAAFMGIMRWAFYNQLKELYPNVSLTYGYITKNTRIRNDLPKEHRVDALCITGNPAVKRTDIWYNQKFVRRNNRSLHKATINKGGFRKENKAPYILHGYRLFDEVLFGRKPYFVFGRRKSGFFDIRDLDGNKVNKGSINSKKIMLLKMATNLLTERRYQQFLPRP
jgi:Restriction endonuclease